MKFVQDRQQRDEQIVTAGAVTTAYQRYYGRPWPLVETASQLDILLNREQPIWLLYAMPASIRASQPEVWGVIERRFTLVRRFPGTLGGGDIYVSSSNDSEGPAGPGR